MWKTQETEEKGLYRICKRCKYGKQRNCPGILWPWERQNECGNWAGNSKGRATSEVDYLSVLEPNVKLFRFEKKNKCYEDLTEEERQEENFNIRNGLNYAKKVLVTQECDMLILDEVLGAVEFGIISDEDVVNLIQAKDEEMEMILTGNVVTPKLKEAADRVVSLEIIK